jgi:hypothetical protein
LHAKAEDFQSSAPGHSKNILPGSLPGYFLLSFGGKWRLGREAESVLRAAIQVKAQARQSPSIAVNCSLSNPAAGKGIAETP